MVCSMCGREWSADEAVATAAMIEAAITDAYGTPLTDGFVGHDIDGKIDGSGAMPPKSEFVRKA